MMLCCWVIGDFVELKYEYGPTIVTTDQQPLCRLSNRLNHATGYSDDLVWLKVVMLLCIGCFL
jgi:hypothetical protein